MPAAFARADLVVCRSGASTVAEITAAGKPAIFVPFPRAADDHQRVNAEALARAGAAVVVEESKLEGVWLAETIAALLGDSRRLQAMSEAARELAHPNAARDIAAMAARVAGIEELAADDGFAREELQLSRQRRLTELDRDRDQFVKSLNSGVRLRTGTMQSTFATVSSGYLEQAYCQRARMTCDARTDSDDLAF